jgi:DNA invertase Pin-like site-specific DNA recombinase
MRAIIYARCSTDEQAVNGTTLEMQTERCKAFVASKGWDCVGVYSDPGYSARSLDRPGIAQVLELVRAKPRKIDAVVTLKLDRLTRSVVDLGHLLTMFRKHGVVLAGPDGVPDTSTTVGELMANILTSVSQWERRTIGDRTRDVLRHRYTRGLTHSAQVPFGYRREGKGKEARFVPVAHELEVVATMREMQSRGFSLREIAHHLTVTGVVTKRGGSAWSPTTVRSILRNRKEVSPE